jgi:hypothetical protein
MTPPESPLAPPRTRRGRVLLWSAALLVACDFLVGAFDSTWNKYSPDEYALRVEGCAKEPRDIVFAGGSPVAEGIDPDIIGHLMWHGREVGNYSGFGLSGGTTSDIYFGLRHACPTAPKVLVYGCTASDLNDSRHEPHGVQSIMTRSDVEDWRRTRPEAGEWVARHYIKGKLAKASALYEHRFGIRMGTASACERLSPGSCPESAAEAQRQRDLDEALHTGCGFAPTKYYRYRRYDHWKEAGWVAPPFAYLANYKTGSHLKYLHRMLERHRSDPDRHAGDGRFGSAASRRVRGVPQAARRGRPQPGGDDPRRARRGDERLALRRPDPHELLGHGEVQRLAARYALATRW